MARTSTKKTQAPAAEEAQLKATEAPVSEEASSNLIMSNPAQLTTVSREPVVVKSGRFTLIHH